MRMRDYGITIDDINYSNEGSRTFYYVQHNGRIVASLSSDGFDWLLAVFALPMKKKKRKWKDIPSEEEIKIFILKNLLPG